MNALLQAALDYASRGWPVIPLHNIATDSEFGCTCSKGLSCGKSAGKHPRIRTGKGHANASVDARQIEEWWERWPNANVGIATGSRACLAVVDLDGIRGVEKIREWGPLPRTLMAATGREGGGRHLYYACAEWSPEIAADGCDLRGDGGLVVAPPSMHVSGRRYAWVDASVPVADMPAGLLDWFKGRGGGERAASTKAARSLSIEGTKGKGVRLAERGLRGLGEEVPPIEDVAAALDLIPNNAKGWHFYNTVGMTVWAATGGSEAGRGLWEAWSARNELHRGEEVAERWANYGRSPPNSLGFGSLVFMAREAEPGWMPPSRAPATKTNGHHSLPAVFQGQVIADGIGDAGGGVGDAGGEGEPVGKSLNPLIKLNKQYSVIGDIGGKCLVMGWTQSKVDRSLKVPSFQSFRTFGERYGSQYVTVRREKPNGETLEEPKQLGTYWLKWTGRAGYEGIDLEPGGEPVLPGKVLNLWSGFAVRPAGEGEAGGAGRGWPLMKRHILEVLARGDVEAARYIWRFAAWAVQHPGEPAEVALVFRGGKGTGKGTFANAIRRLFGQHGLQIYSSKHLVGSFNGHLKNCLLLFADEAFWAGDKQGESVLKGMLTESVLMIEHKGLDAIQWKNRLHVIMSANAEWVVPASHDERRYCIFDVSPDRARDREYFRALVGELNGGGLEAMLGDLLRADLGDWHPRDIIQNTALQEQKAMSLKPLYAWFENVLQEGHLPFASEKTPNRALSANLLDDARQHCGRKDVINGTNLGRFLRRWGGEGLHQKHGNLWILPKLRDIRLGFDREFGVWEWREELEDWR